MKNSLVQQLDSALEKLCLQGVSEGVFPGVAAGIAWREKSGRWQRVVRTAGRTRTEGGKGPPVTRDTLFDLASLTKPLATALIIVALADEGRLSTDDRLALFFGLEDESWHNIDLDMLLTHSSGLAPYNHYYREFSPGIDPAAGEAIVRRILTGPLLYEPGTECRYSDLGFILLGRVIEQVTGMDLDECFRKYVSARTGLEDEIFYLPLGVPGQQARVRNMAATENCPWRGRVLQGEVHDEHCWLMGGVSGHAGLFGTVDAVLTLCVHILDRWQGRGEQPAGDTLQLALRKKYGDRTWCRGFDTPSPEGSSGGSLLSADSVGHLGYTGTSFWIDPEKEVIIVLLSNRVHPTRENILIRRFRPRFHDVLLQTLGGSMGK